jgi:hypothetical protein
MHVATCFDSNESSSGYYTNHNIDISNGNAHLGSQNFTQSYTFKVAIKRCPMISINLVQTGYYILIIAISQFELN